MPGQARGKRLASEAAANDNTEGCKIKGNIGSKGDRIYHMPGGRWYDKTVITASKGERWFCSEDEAPVYHRGTLIGFCTAQAGWQRIDIGDDANQTNLPGWRPWR